MESLSRRGEPQEPIRGANAFRLPRTRRDSARALMQMRGSPSDSLRPGQTPDSCLGVKGSPVQIRPPRLVVEFFRTYLCPHQSQPKSHSIVKWPFQRRTPTMCPGLLPGHSSTRQNPRNRQSRGQRSPSHPGSAQRPRQPRTPRTPSPAHRLTASQTHTGPQKLWDAGRPERTRQACPRHRRRDAYWHALSLRTNRHDSCQRHGKRLAVMKCAYRRLCVHAVMPSLQSACTQILQFCASC